MRTNGSGSHAQTVAKPPATDAATARGDTSDLSRFVENLIESLRGHQSTPVRTLILALRGLSMYIQKVQGEIFAAGPSELKTHHIPAAADELEAIVSATAQATHTIMDATEAVQTAAMDLDPETQAVLFDASTRIFEACAFQDITGQRVAKVVTALRYIEEKIDALAGIVGANLRQSVDHVAELSEQEFSDEDLCNGPQLPELAKTQADIDALFDDL